MNLVIFSLKHFPKIGPPWKDQLYDKMKGGSAEGAPPSSLCHDYTLQGGRIFGTCFYQQKPTSLYMEQKK